MSNVQNIDSIGLQDVLTALKISEAPESWAEHWDASRKAFDPASLAYLEPDQMVSANEWLQISDDAFPALLAAAELVRENPMLSILAWHWHYLLLRVPGFPDYSFSWPLPTETMGDLAPMFPAVIGVSGLNLMLQGHSALGIPDDVTLAGLQDFNRWLRNHKKRFGVWGMKELRWLLRQLRCNLFEVGRLQFMAAPCYLAMRVFKNNGDGAIVVLSQPGIKYRSDGLLDGTNDIYDEDNAWVSELEMSEQAIRGNPISSDGYAHSNLIELDAREWTEVLSQGSPIIEVHIPAGRKMCYDECMQSFRRAFDFYGKHFPNTNWNAFTCFSWLLDGQLADLLPVESNIVMFQRLYHLLPVMSDDGSTFMTVFGRLRTDDMSGFPRETALQRAILDYASKGNRMRCGGGFIMRDDPCWNRI